MASPRVLIVDDEQPLARVLGFAFENEGYTVELAADGVECMNRIRRFEPQLVVMDVMMPRLDGLETIRLLRQNSTFHDVAIVALSARATARDHQAALDAGADLFCKKPFQVARLLETVDGLLAMRGGKGG